VTFSAEELSKEDFFVTDSGGNEMVVALSSDRDFNCLIPRSLTRDDIEVSFITETGHEDGVPTVKAVFTLNAAHPSFDITHLGELEMLVTLIGDDGEAVQEHVDGSGNVPAGFELAGYEPAGHDGQMSNLIESGGLPALAWALIIAGILLAVCVFLYIKGYLVIQKR
jgi:hypothetical protein